MSKLNYLCILVSLAILKSSTYAIANTPIISIVNMCYYTVWAAALPGGGRRLDPGQVWILPQSNNTTVWARTDCKFDANGRGSCLTGDCAGRLDCKVRGQAPYTMAQYRDIGKGYYISLLEGYNVPMLIYTEADAEKNKLCNQTMCTDVDWACPPELKAHGGCNDPCTVFKTEKYCCNSKRRCKPTKYSRSFKEQCHDAMTYPADSVGHCYTRGWNTTLEFCVDL